MPVQFFTRLFLAATGVALSAAYSAQAAPQLLTIGTGEVTGVYYPTGGAICRLVNQGRKEHGIRCSVESTGGSIYNVNAIINGDLELGVVQSDWQYNAFHASSVFAGTDGTQKLRSLFSLHSESFTVVARADAGIRSFDDLKGKRVNIGNPGSGMRATMEEVMRQKGWKRGDFKRITELKAADQAEALCANKIDAMLFAAGHPNGLIQTVTDMCPTVLVPMTGASIDALLEKHPYYARSTIPGGMYKGNPKDIATFGVRATLLASTSLSDEAAYEITKAVFENFDAFKTLHFVFATLDKQEMAHKGLTAPLHVGALRYFQEAGLVKDEAAPQAAAE